MGCYLQSENTVAPGSSSTMPASVNENVTASLLLSLSSKCGPENGEIPLEQRMAAASKRVLVKDVQYEVSTNTYHNSVLQGLKAKYTDQNDNETNQTNGTSSSMGKGIVDPSSPCLPIPAKVLFPADRVQMSWPTRYANGSGFTNAGNSCYLNSVLQALFHIPPMVNWLMEGDMQHQRGCGTMLNSTTECIVCCMAVTLKHSQQRSGSDMRPHLILARLRSICKRLIPGQQEDAMEFLRYLFEAMEKSYLSRFSNTKLDSNSKETTPLNQIFGGYIRTDVTCLHCRGVSTTFQHFLDLTLDISRGPSLEHALDTYFCQERLEGENSYRCDKCRRKVPAAKQFFIERLPNVLCIQLKRFSIEGKKISKCVQLAERINLQRFLSRPKTGPSGASQSHKPARGACYRLQAGVNHLGHTAQSGHYTTTAYTASGNLYLFDDSCVQRYWSRSFSGTDVYLLMYMLETPRQDGPRLGAFPSASATSTSQTIQTVTPRLPTKATISPFIPAQCRSKTPTILSNNRKMFNSPLSLKEPLVAPTKSPNELAKSKHPLGIENKPSKLVTPSPQIIRDGNVASVSPTKSTAQTSAASSSFTPLNERGSMKARNGLSMPSLVPYPQEDNSSGDEGDVPALVKVPSKEPSASTNGWTVTKNGPNLSNKDLSSDIVNSEKQAASVESFKKLVNLPESPRKMNGLDVQSKKSSPKASSDSTSSKKGGNKQVINNSETFNGKKSSDGDTSSLAESDSSVRSTVPAWHVSPATKSPNKEMMTKPEPCVEPRGGLATANWEVTSAPTSAEQSPGTSLPSPSSSPAKPQPNQEQQQQKQNGGVKRKQSSRRSSSSSSSDSSSDSSSSDNSSRHRKKVKKQEVWVERTIDTINGDHKKSKGNKRSAEDSSSRTPVSEELRKMSHSGYGGAHVSTWNGGRSLIDRQVREDYFENRRNHQEECDYDPEMDAGRRKKMKSDNYERDNAEESYSKGNRFQKEADYRRNYNHYDDRTARDYRRKSDHNSQNRNYRPYNNSSQHYNRSNRNQHWNQHKHSDYSRGRSNHYDSRNRYHNSGKYNGHRNGHR